MSVSKNLSLEYESKQILYLLEYGKNFKVDGKVIDTRYPRYDSPYVQGNKKDNTFSFSKNGKSLFLDSRLDKKHRETHDKLWDRNILQL